MGHSGVFGWGGGLVDLSPMVKAEKTRSGIPGVVRYGPESAVGRDFAAKVGESGEFPFTRGIQPTMYRGRLWTMRQYAGMGDADESNRRYKFLLAHGTKGLSVAFR